MFFEGSSFFNCGVGSNRTSDGCTENECCIMDSTGLFAAVCMIPENISPYKVVSRYVKIERAPGLVKPVAIAYSDKLSISSNEPEDSYLEEPIPPFYQEKSKEYSLFDKKEEDGMPSDTVGVAEIRRDFIRAVSSSGGPREKYPGRIGPCTVYGANTFVSQNTCVLISGTGESLIKAQLARSIHKKVDSMLFEEIRDEIEEFMLKEKDFPYIGGVGVHRRSPSEVFIVHFQSSASFVFGYNINSKIKVVGHRQKPGIITINVEKINIPEDSIL